MKKQTGKEKVRTEDGFVILNGAPVPGKLGIHKNAFSTIIRRSVLSVDGVSRLSGNSIFGNIADLVGSKKFQDRSIQINFKDADTLSVDIAINIFAGRKIAGIVENIRKKVPGDIQSFTGFKVAEVNVSVREMDDLPAQDDEEN